MAFRVLQGLRVSFGIGGRQVRVDQFNQAVDILGCYLSRVR